MNTKQFSEKYKKMYFDFHNEMEKNEHLMRKFKKNSFEYKMANVAWNKFHFAALVLEGMFKDLNSMNRNDS